MNICAPFKNTTVILSLLLTACTTGRLDYIDANGVKKIGCEVEFTGSPSVDKYAVEYSLSLCAKSIVKKGYKIEELYLLDIDTSIPQLPCGQVWNHELAKQKYKAKQISSKEYGYIVANIDLGLAEKNNCIVAQ